MTLNFGKIKSRKNTNHFCHHVSGSFGDISAVRKFKQADS
jgi:hypothetical protein